LALVVDFETKDPWFKPQAAQKSKKKRFFFQNDPFPLPKFLRITDYGLRITELQKSQNCTEIFTVCSVEQNPEVFFVASLHSKHLSK
jgi:hypothetical protein